MMAATIRVLYVDDEPSLLNIGKVFLERSGDFAVTTATSAPDAIRILGQERFDAIISDYQMPEMDGIEFLKVVRASGDKTPFIIFTGKGREEIVIQALNCGADFYLQKGGESKSQFAELAHKILRAVEHQSDEKSLVKSQVQLAEAMDLAYIVNWEFDVASGLFTFNDRFYALYGTTAEREGGYQMPAEVYAREFVHPDEVSMVADEVQNAITATDPNYTRQIEHRIIRRDGEIRHIIVRFGITKDTEGRTIKTHGANQDITDRKRIEQALQVSEARYRSIVEDQTEFICRFTPDGKLTFVNDAYCRYFTLDKDRCLAHPQSVVLPPEDVRQMKQHLASLTRENPVATIEHRIIMPSGEVRWQRWNDRAIFSENGNVVEYQSVGRDITEIKNADKSLLEREAYYRAVFENTGTASVIVEEDTTISLANAEFANLCGYSHEEIEGKRRWTEFVVKEDLERMLAQHYSRRKDRKKAERNYEFRFVRKSGEVRNIYLSIDVIPGTKKSIASLLDITEYKKAEQALRESEEKLRSLFQILPVGVTILDKNQNIVNLNPALEQILSFSRDELMRGDHRQRRHLRSDGTPMPPEEYASSRAIAGQTVVSGVETGVVKEDGSIIWTTVSAAPLAGDELSAVIVTTDITERKRAEDALRKSEKQYRSLLEHVPELILVHRNGIILYTNPAAVKTLGYQPHEALHRQVTDFIAPEFHERVADAMHRRMSGKMVEPYEIDVISRDGSWRRMIINGTQIEFEGAPASLIVLIDITEQKALQDAVTLANKKLNLLSSITRHDIINQLSALNGYLELSRDILHDPVKLEEFITKQQNIARTIEAQIRFTKDYQDLGIKAPEWQNVHESVVAAKASLSLRGIAVETDSPTLEVYADPLLVRVFYNLIDNALRYGGEQMTAIRISSQEIDARLLIICENDGMGIPADKKVAIFNRGYFKHTGFGLFLSREILSITGITITENGTPGKGARFEITVPKGMFRFTDTGEK